MMQKIHIELVIDDLGPLKDRTVLNCLLIYSHYWIIVPSCGHLSYNRLPKDSQDSDCFSFS